MGVGGVKNSEKLPTSFMDDPLLKGFTKNFSFEDFQNFQEISAYCGQT